MSGTLIQDVVATAIALGAAGVIVRRIAGFVRPAPTGSAACTSCASGAACGSTKTAAPAAAPLIQISMPGRPALAGRRKASNTTHA